MARMMLDENEDGKLDKDALIYQTRSADGKADYVNLSKKGKIRYFFDYHFKTVLLIVLALAAITYFLVKQATKPQVELYVAVADAVLNEEQLDHLETATEKYLGLDGKKQVVVINTDYNTENYQALQQLQTYVYSGNCDVLISSENGMKYCAQNGYLCAPDVFDQVSFYRDFDSSRRFYSIVTDGETIRGEKQLDQTKYNFAIRLDGSKKYKDLGGVPDQFYIAVVNSSKRVDEAAAFVKYMLDNDLDYDAVNQELQQ